MSLGFENKFKHPAPEVVAHYMEHGARVLRTDPHGCGQGADRRGEYGGGDDDRVSAYVYDCRADHLPHK
ncbi:MAG: hypothetical protein VX893_17900 [Candidatus Latescibacterota bacterium]|nr:hypothetical protein [Candidatus Latescibacterota bacterium]